MRLSTLFLPFFIALTYALNNESLLKHQKKSKSNIIKLTKNNFESILQGPRDSHILVLLTATNPQIGCAICTSIQPEYEKLANSWAKDHPNGDNLFFARADFADGNPEIFQKFQLNNVPRIFLYSPSDKAVPFTQDFDTLNVPQDVGEFAPYYANILSEALQLRFKVYEEINYGNIIVTAVFTFLIIYGLKKNSKSVWSVLQSKPLWGGITVFSILFFVSGYMFNAIRGVPYVKGGRDGAVEYFTRGQQNQLGAETQALAFVYAILAFSVVSLVTKVKTIQNDKVHLFVVVGLLGLVWVFYSILISIFSFKSSGYPFLLSNIWSP